MFITFFLKTLHMNLRHSICVEARGQLAKVRSHLLSRGFPGMKLRSSGLAAGVVTHWAISLTLTRSFLLVSQGLVQMLLPLGNITLASIDVWGKKKSILFMWFSGYKRNTIWVQSCRKCGPAKRHNGSFSSSWHRCYTPLRIFSVSLSTLFSLYAYQTWYAQKKQWSLCAC